MARKRIELICKVCGKKFTSYTVKQCCSRKCLALTGRHKAKDTLCWDCENATGGCSWSKRFIPVEGWDAIPTRVNMTVGKKVDSYTVVSCPLFKKG